MALTVKYKGCVVNIAIPHIRHAAGDDIYTVLFRKAAYFGLYPFRRALRHVLKPLLWVKACVPGFRQQYNIRRVCRGLVDKFSRMAEVFIRTAQRHIHLDTAYFHQCITFRKDLIYYIKPLRPVQCHIKGTLKKQQGIDNAKLCCYYSLQWVV